MDQKDIVRSLTATVGSFIQDRLIDKEQRTKQKEHCAERLAAEDGGTTNRDTEIRYSDQAVLANLDWGIDALEEAITTSNMETKMARLDYAEKMLQVCAMLNSTHTTAGVPNSYLSAWAHLNLSYLWKLRNNVHNAVLHILDMFIIDPFFSRIDFAPDLWKSLFLPHTSSIVGWYSEERHRIVMDVIPDSNDLSFTLDLDQYFNESLILSVRPDQAEKMEELEQIYGQSLDENTRLYSKYYKECINYDSATTKKAIPMLPIAEPPMTPLHEVSQKIPDFVKFGPILPKSAGFSPVLKAQADKSQASRLLLTSTSLENPEDYALRDPKQGIPEESEDDSDYEHDTYMQSRNKGHKSTSSYSSSSRVKKNAEASPKVKNRSQQPTNFSPVESPQAPLTRDSPPKPDLHCRKEPPPLLRLMSNRKKDDAASVFGNSPSYGDSSISSSDTDDETREQHRNVRKSIGHGQSASQVLEKSFSSLSDEGNQSCTSLPLPDKLTPQSRPPKDFVCPITGQIFYDPVTLETGQTYERKAIQEWIDRGNTTCPITRQPLSAIELPKTNYVLKRLITSWKEQHPDIAQEMSYAETPRSNISMPSPRTMSSESTPSRITNHPNCRRLLDNEFEHKPRRFLRAAVSTSPTSVLSQAAVESVINALKPYISCLCNSEDLQECEAAVLTISRIWNDSKIDSGIHSYLSSPTIVNGFIEILSASLNRNVLRTTIHILTRLIYADDSVGGTLTSVDTDFDCLATLLKNGLAEAAILIYLLRPSFSQLSAHNLIPYLTQLISSKSEDPNDIPFVIAPKDAALALLDYIAIGGDENSRTLTVANIISSGVIPSLIKCLDRVDGRQSIVSILLCCIRADKSCRSSIANRIELSHVLELFHTGNDTARATCIEFFSELVLLTRRTSSNRILQIIKDEGAFSTMHTLLVYLQMSPMDQKPVIASLLLQLDLLAEPRKMSIYREEAVEALIEALRKKDFPASQVVALDALSSLPGHLNTSGKSCLEAWLLKLAGFDQPYRALTKEESPKTYDRDLAGTTEEEEKAVNSWGKRVAFVLCNHEKGFIFRALEECFKSHSLEIAKSCLVMATWLVHMLYNFLDIGTRDIARKSLLDQFINVLQSSKNIEEKILASLALRGFLNDPGALAELGVYAKCMYRTLRKLKRYSVVINDLLKTLINLPSIDAAELWSYAEGPEMDVSMNGEVLSMLHIRGRLISGHSDGTIKVWDAGKKVPRLIQEVREHTRAVTCLCLSSSGDKLYSGSLDKTIRVWAIKQEEIHCIQVHDVKEAVLEMSVDSKAACFSSQGSGVKVYYWSGVPRHVNFNKTVKGLVLVGDKLYCGCSGYSIQEVDISSLTSTVFYAGTRKLLGKQTIFAVEAHRGLLLAGGSAVDGVAGKVFSLPNKAVLGSLSTGFDIQKLTANSDFIFGATKMGVIEVWLKERVSRIGYIRLSCGGNAKLTSLVSDSDGQMLFVGTSDGKIKVLILN